MTSKSTATCDLLPSLLPKFITVRHLTLALGDNGETRRTHGIDHLLAHSDKPRSPCLTPTALIRTSVACSSYGSTPLLSNVLHVAVATCSSPETALWSSSLLPHPTKQYPAMAMAEWRNLGNESGRISFVQKGALVVLTPAAPNEAVLRCRSNGKLAQPGLQLRRALS